jgi:hypothetical protein
MFTDLMEIGNIRTDATKGQFTLYTNSGDLGIDFNTSDFHVIDAGYSTGIVHKFECRVFFGDTTYIAYTRYDSTELPVHISSNTQLSSFVKKLWVQYPSTVTDQTVDWDDIWFWYGDADPGWLDDAPTASGTASLSLSASGAGQAPVSGTAAISLSATGTTGPPLASGSASISLSASGADKAAVSGVASITLTASGAEKAKASGTASLTLSAEFIVAGSIVVVQYLLTDTTPIEIVQHINVAGTWVPIEQIQQL